MHLPEKKRIEVLIMIGFEDKMGTQQEGYSLFNATHPDGSPVIRFTLSKVESKFLGMFTVTRGEKK